MHVSPGIKVKYRAGTIGAVYSALWDDEKPMAVFAISRARRVANVLAITDQRVLTFRRVGRKYPLEDSIDGADIADGFVLTTGPNRANASVFIGMDEISLGTVLRVSDAELRYIGALLRWITGTQALEPQVGLHELVTARRGAQVADPEAAQGGARQQASGGEAVATHGSHATNGTIGGSALDVLDASLAEPGSNGAAAARPNGDNDVLTIKVSDEIVELARLHAEGVLSGEEFSAAKAALIAKI